MSEPHLAIGPLMKAARKFKKFNQSDVANAIGCSQSALSKMEHNLLIPNAPQWFLFSRYTSIPPEAIERGVIDRHSRVKLNDDSVSLGFKLPKRYRQNRAQKVREVYPFLNYLEKKIDGDQYQEFFSSIGLESEFFLDFDNTINFQLIVDLMNFYIRQGLSSVADIRKIVQYGQDSLYWERFVDEWKKFKGVKELLIALSQEQKFFQADFVIHVQEVNQKLMVSFTPENHLYHFLKDVSEETQRFFTIYRQASLENLILLTLDLNVEVRVNPELSNSPLENHFEIDF